MTVKSILLSFLAVFFAKVVNGQLVASFSADRVSGCTPIRVIFDNQSTGTNASTRYRWDLGNGAIGNSEEASATYFTPGTYTIKLTIYNGNDSSVATRVNYITVYAIPEVNFTGQPRLGCLPFPVQFKDSSNPGSGTITDRKWDFGDGFLGTGASPLHVYRSPGVFTVTLIAENSFGCVNSATKESYVTVLDSINAKFGVTPPPVCTVPALFRFTDSSTGANINRYFWDFGDGATSTQRNPSHTYTVSGTYTVKLVIGNTTGCSDTAIGVNIVNAGNFNANFTVGGAVCVGRPATLLNTSTPANQLLSSRWAFGNGGTSTETNPAPIYYTPGNYTVRLIANFGQCQDTVNRVINVVPQPVANFSATPTGACKPPLTVQFTNETVGGAVVKWYFGNGDSSVAAAPSVTYNDYGSYSVRLIVRNSSGCLDTLDRPGYINIRPPAISRITGLPHRGCVPWTNTFGVEVSSPESVARYEWDFGDGTQASGSNPQHTFTDTGTFVVKVVVTTVGGCTDTLTSWVEGGLRPKAGLKAEPLLVCPSDLVSFTSTSTGPIDEWLWTFGDGGTSGAPNPTYKYNDTGFMTVRLVVAYKGCGDTIFMNKYVYVNPPISRFTDSFVCGNQYKHIFTETAIGAKYWKWYIDDKDSVEGRQLEYTFTDTGRHEVRLYVTDSICYHEFTMPVVVLDEKASFVTSDSGNCRNTFVTFSGQGAKLNISNVKLYEWDFGDGSDLITTDTSVFMHTYSQPGVVPVRLVITDLNNCTDTVTQPVNVRLYGPQAKFGPAFTALCAGQTATFSDSTGSDITNPITKWIWNFGSGGGDTLFTAAPFTHTYKNAGVYNVRLVVEDMLGCRDTVWRRRAVAVYKPKADFISTDTLICINASAKFQDLSSGAELKYKWDFGDGQTSSSAAPANRYMAEGLYDVKLVVSDSLNCMDSIHRPAYIRVKDAESHFTVSDSFTTCPPLLVIFSNNSTNNVTNNWDFGNGNTSSLANPSHTYTTPGIFTVKLKVTGNGGCTDTLTKTIKIEGPSGRFSYDPLSGCPPITVNFVSNAINTRNFTWDFSDGESTLSVDSVTSHVYRIPGTFVPRLILSDDLGCKLPVQGPDTIRVFGARALIKSLPDYVFCDTATVAFNDSTITNDIIISRKWDFGDGSPTSSEQNPVHKYTRTGVFYVIFEVRTAGGCVSIDTIRQPITVAPTPIISLGNNEKLCLPASVRFQAVWQNQDTSTIAWDWDFGNGQTSTQFRPPAVSYGVPGEYAIRLYATNRYGCADTTGKILTINDTPNIVAGPSTYLCLGQSVTLGATGAAQYRWDNNASLSCLNCQQPVARPSSQQIYRVVGTDTNGCRSSDTVLVKVKQPAYLSVGPGDTLCVGESFQLQSSGTEWFKWEPAAGLSSSTIPNPVATPLQTTRYRVVGYDSMGCFYDTAYINMVVYPIPQFNILEEKIVAPTGNIVKLKTTSSSDITSWRWSPPTGLNCITCPEPELIVTRPVTYTARVSNDGGCRADDRVTIVPTCTPDNVFIPNTFSPNGDGQNDLFYPRGKGVAAIKSMRIFSRWGELLYEQKDFAVNDASAGWDGTYKGSRLTPDVYVYVIDVLCENNIVFNLKGNITLLK